MKGIDQTKTFFGMNQQPTSNTDAPIRGVYIAGENPDIDTGVPESVWEVGGTFAFPTAASTCTIVSSDAADTYGTGTGAWIVLIEGLDEDYNEIWEVVNLDGVTPVVSTNSYFRINFFRVVYSGTGKKNTGNITATVDSKTIRYISAGESLDHTAVYTVPVGHTLFLTKTSFSVVKSSTNINASIVTKVFVPSTNTEIESGKVGAASNAGPSGGNFPRDSRPKIPETSDIWYECEYVSANNADVSLFVRGLLVFNNQIPEIYK